MTASLADLYSRWREPCIPSARSRIFLCRALAVTPRLTLAIYAIFLQVRRQPDHRASISPRCAVLGAVLALSLAALVFEQMRAKCLASHDLSCGGDAEALLGSLMRSDLWHPPPPLPRSAPQRPLRKWSPRAALCDRRCAAPRARASC